MHKWLANQMSRRQEGFTLIELMVVVAILAVLAFIALPRVLEALDKSKLNSGISIGNEIANAMERYAAKNGEASVVSYPTSGQVGSYADLVTFMGTTNNIATLPDSTAAARYFLSGAGGITYAYTPTTNASGNVSDYLIDLTSTSRTGMHICIKPTGVTAAASC